MSTLTEPNPEVTPEEAFALILETACEDFETLLALIRKELEVVAPHSVVTIVPSRAQARIVMALAKSFVFNARRASRICEKNKVAIGVDRDVRKSFLKATAPLTPVRDVNEHGNDGDNRSIKPSLHNHEGAILDETSLVVAGPETVLMGPLNLFILYQDVDRMRKLAGFSALRGRQR